MGNKSIFRQNERWIVNVGHKIKNEYVIMDEYYLYLLDFIYGDKEQQKKEGVSRPRKKQFVGNKQTVSFKGENIRCKIVLPSDEKRGKDVVFGEIRFEQDFGFIIDIYGDNGKKNEDTFLKITDNLKITICEFELTFKKDGSDDDDASQDGGGVTAGTDKSEEEKAKSGETEEKHGATDGTTCEGSEAKEDNAEAKEDKAKKDEKTDRNDALKSGVRKILEMVIEWLRKLSEKLGGK